MEIIFPHGYKTMFSPHFLVHKLPSEPVARGGARPGKLIAGCAAAADPRGAAFQGHEGDLYGGTRRLILEDVYNRYTHKITQVYQDSTHTHTHPHIHTYTHIDMYIYIYIYIYMNIHTHIDICMYVCIHT